MSPCSRCGVDKGQRKHKWCTVCFNRHRYNRWKRKKIELATILGGKCSHCGWAPSAPYEFAALDFHHRDPSTKNHDIKGNLTLSKSAHAEIQKCDLLCSRCHRLHHAQIAMETWV